MSAGSPAVSGPRAADAGRTTADAPALADALASELAAEPWDYPWRLAPGLVTPVEDPCARHAAWSLERMVEAPVREALAAPDSEGTAIDLGCGEGALARVLGDLGARRVVGVETRARRLRRAELISDHFGDRVGTLELSGVDDPGSLDPTVLGSFDVVLLVGIFDRVEDTGALIRLAQACTRGLCVIESDGSAAPAHAQAARAAGFASVRRVPPPPDAEARYALGRRTMLIAVPAGSA